MGKKVLLKMFTAAGIVLLVSSCTANISTTAGNCGPRGAVVRFENQPVACMFRYGDIHNNLSYYCSMPKNVMFFSPGYGQGPEIVRQNDCMVCVTAERPDVVTKIKEAAGGKPEPQGFSPSISCLNIFLPTPVPPDF